LGDISYWSTLMGGNVHTAMKSTEGLLICSKETGLDVTAEKTK